MKGGAELGEQRDPHLGCLQSHPCFPRLSLSPGSLFPGGELCRGCPWALRPGRQGRLRVLYSEVGRGAEGAEAGGVGWEQWVASSCLTTLHLVPRDALCGILQCQGGEQSPLAPHTMPVDSTFHLGSHEEACKGAFLLLSAQMDLPNFGMVEPGTQCGPRMVSPPAPWTFHCHLSPTGQSITAQ